MEEGRKRALRTLKNVIGADDIYRLSDLFKEEVSVDFGLMRELVATGHFKPSYEMLGRDILKAVHELLGEELPENLEGGEKLKGTSVAKLKKKRQAYSAKTEAEPGDDLLIPRDVVCEKILGIRSSTLSLYASQGRLYSTREGVPSKALKKYIRGLKKCSPKRRKEMLLALRGYLQEHSN